MSSTDDVNSTAVETPPPAPVRTGPIDDNSPRLMWSIWSLSIMATVFIAARLYVKAGMGKRGLWWDDHILLVCLIIFVATVQGMVQYGWGKRNIDLPKNTDEETVAFMLLSLVGGCFGILAAMLSKTSFAVTLLRISSGWFKISIWVLMITTNIAMSGSILVSWLRCTPVQSLWKTWVESKCWDMTFVMHYHLFGGAYSAFSDFALALVPWLIVRKLQMKRPEKIGVAIAMSLGFFAGATAVVKTVMLTAFDMSDFFYEGANLSIWSAAESAVTIVAASIPVLRVFIRQVQTSRDKSSGVQKSKTGNATSRISHGGSGKPGILQSTGSNGIQDGAHSNLVTVAGGDAARVSTADDASDKSILGRNHIIKTEQVDVEYHNGKAEGDGTTSTFELKHLDV